MWVIKRKLRFQGYKNCLEAAKTENKVNHLEQNKLDSITENKKKQKKQKKKKTITKNNKPILKTQQRSENERHIEEVY